MRISDWSSDVCSSDLQIIGVGRILVAGMDAEASLGRKDGLAIVSRRIIAERAHQLRAPRPYRIGVQGLHLVDYLRRVPVPPLLQPLICHTVERIQILFEAFRVLLVPLTAATSHSKST